MTDPLWNGTDTLTDGWDEQAWVSDAWTGTAALTDGWTQTAVPFSVMPIPVLIEGDDSELIIGDDGEYIEED